MTGGIVIKLGDRLLGQLNRTLAKAGATPTLANMLELAAAAGCSICLSKRFLGAALSLLAIHALFDYLDGGLQRTGLITHTKQHLGKFQHMLVDKLSDALLFTGAAIGKLVPFWLAIAATTATVIVSLTGLLCTYIRSLKRDDCVFDRADRILAILLLFPFSLFRLALLTSIVMNVAVTLQRLHRVLYDSNKTNLRSTHFL